MEGPADVITVLDPHVTTVRYPVHRADSGDELPTTQQSQTLISNTRLKPYSDRTCFTGGC